MTLPPPPEAGSTTSLRELAGTLREEPAYVREGHTARSIVHAPDLRVVLVVLRAETTIAEHHAANTATVHALSGALRLQVAGTTIALAEGQLLRLDAGVRHDVFATSDSSFLLTLGRSPSPSP